jgi:hypothetical protein
MCYLNCDIILLTDFLDAFERVRRQMPKFLMVGRRWDTDITRSIDFGRVDWEDRNAQAGAEDWPAANPCFHKGLYQEIPGLVVGRN